MAEEKTYLELSEAQGSSHKFYEVILDGAKLTIRYGRIGTDGKTDVKTYPTPEKAKTDGDKKIKEKLRKGYEHAVMGVRKKRAVTRRDTLLAAPSGAAAKKALAKHTAPVIWKFQSGSQALGIFIDENHCWVGNQQGSVFCLDHNCNVLNQYRLPDGVKCIISDGVWLYAGCDNGNVYDLTGKLPRVGYEISEDVDIYWIDINDALLAVSDAGGTVMIANHEDEQLWKRRSKGNYGWMVRCDREKVYHGHSMGVTAYSGWEDPREVWDFRTTGSVFFGWQEKDTVYAGTTGNKIFAINKETGHEEKIYSCDATVFSCSAAEDGKYVFAGDNYGSVYCFDREGNRLWKLSTGCGAAFSMQYFKEHVYIVTTDGSLACIDASEEAIKAAQTGVVPQSRSITAPKPVEVADTRHMESVTGAGDGVIVKCFREGGKMRIRVISEGYHKDWNVQFPRDIREEGASYVVDQIIESSGGGFYRAYGDIKKLER
ncbi:MAG: WGR domain-containing protein [Candidatus Eremiobacterota bacterium]